MTQRGIAVAPPSGYTQRREKETVPERAAKESGMKKFFGLFAVLGAAAAGLMFWRKRQNDDEFLDEELE